MIKIKVQLLSGGGVGSGIYSYYLPKDPTKSKRLEDVTHPLQRERSTSREYYDREIGIKTRFDKGNPKEHGWAREDHYHVYNPKSTGDNDKYLDKDGNPCPNGSKDSHLTREEFEKLMRGIGNGNK